MLGQDRSESRDWDWDDDGDAPARRRPRRRTSPFRRMVTLVKLALFLMPLGLFLFGNLFADCRARPSFADWASMLGASACARSEMIGNATSMQENFAALRRLID
ncbi:hypothetical protein [Methylobacterium sp. J-076]|uniref:hypothetical protein n=1 Tax=Methylobacterium sp. J-076 TaxID=2836655 RepID=UPI001FB8D5C7|nr:hypothetical protein [Methylobacterium sp. J-076]MCJ2012851.1 hypothetical protein [Methylobacterium sp. J-076]